MKNAQHHKEGPASHVRTSTPRLTPKAGATPNAARMQRLGHSRDAAVNVKCEKQFGGFL